MSDGDTTSVSGQLREWGVRWVSLYTGRPYIWIADSEAHARQEYSRGIPEEARTLVTRTVTYSDWAEV